MLGALLSPPFGVVPPPHDGRDYLLEIVAPLRTIFRAGTASSGPMGVKRLQGPVVGIPEASRQAAGSLAIDIGFQECRFPCRPRI
jgi:hypothetical protein